MKRKLFWIALGLLVALPLEVRADDFAKEILTEMRKAVAFEAGPLGNVGIPLQSDKFGLINATPFYLKVNANKDMVAIMWPGDIVPFKHGIDLMRPVGFEICITIRAYRDTACTDYVGGYQLRFGLGSRPVLETQLIRVSDIERVDGDRFTERDLPPPHIRRAGPYNEKEVGIKRYGDNASTVVQLLNNTRANMEVRIFTKWETTVSSGEIFFKVFERYPHVEDPFDQSNWRKEINLTFWDGDFRWGFRQEYFGVPAQGQDAYQRVFSPRNIQQYGTY